MLLEYVYMCYGIYPVKPPTNRLVKHIAYERIKVRLKCYTEMMKSYFLLHYSLSHTDTCGPSLPFTTSERLQIGATQTN